MCVLHNNNKTLYSINEQKKGGLEGILSDISRKVEKLTEERDSLLAHTK